MTTWLKFREWNAVGFSIGGTYLMDHMKKKLTKGQIVRAVRDGLTIW